MLLTQYISSFCRNFSVKTLKFPKTLPLGLISSTENMKACGDNADIACIKDGIMSSIVPYLLKSDSYQDIPIARLL